VATDPQDLTTTAPSAGIQPVAIRLAEVERYALLEQLGEGAMGVVYAAYDATLDRKVALKLLPDHQLGGEHRDRLLREARALAQLSHPNVVAVYDVGETQGRVFFAMEFVRGQTVAAWARERRTLEEILDVFRAAARGLAAAHAASLVHRDVKPSNLLLGDDGRVRVADFGLAHPGRGLAAGTPDGPGVVTGFAGSPAYMAPEQLRDAIADARSDQFALCVSLYEVLHGRRPFSGETPAELLAAIEAGPSPPARAVPAWVTSALARGLALDPASRFPDMAALVSARVPLTGPRSRRQRPRASPTRAS